MLATEVMGDAALATATGGDAFGRNGGRISWAREPPEDNISRQPQGYFLMRPDFSYLSGQPAAAAYARISRDLLHLHFHPANDSPIVFPGSFVPGA